MTSSIVVEPKGTGARHEYTMGTENPRHGTGSVLCCVPLPLYII
jgi:hypothetical protein